MTNTADPSRGAAAAQIREQPYITGRVQYTGPDDDHPREFELDTRWSGAQGLSLRRLLGVTPDDVAVTSASMQRGTMAVGVDTFIAWTIAAGVAGGYRWTQTEVDELLELRPAELGERLKWVEFELHEPDGEDEGGAETSVAGDLADGEDPTAPATGGLSD